MSTIIYVCVDSKRSQGGLQGAEGHTAERDKDPRLALVSFVGMGWLRLLTCSCLCRRYLPTLSHTLRIADCALLRAFAFMCSSACLVVCCSALHLAVSAVLCKCIACPVLNAAHECLLLHVTECVLVTIACLLHVCVCVWVLLHCTAL